MQLAVNNFFYNQKRTRLKKCGINTIMISFSLLKLVAQDKFDPSLDLFIFSCFRLAVPIYIILMPGVSGPGLHPTFPPPRFRPLMISCAFVSACARFPHPSFYSAVFEIHSIKRPDLIGNTLGSYHPIPPGVRERS